MAAEVLYPDALVFTANLTGAVTAIDDDADLSASDADYLPATSATAVSTLEVSFPTPASAPTSSQNMKFRIRQLGDPSGTQSVTVTIKDGGTVIKTLSVGLAGDRKSVV